MTAPPMSLLPPARSGTFVDDDVLEARFGDLSRPLVAQLLAAELARLAPLEAERDLALGRLLDAFVRRGGVQDLGHARRRDFAPSRLGFSWGHGLELIRVAKALGRLPILRAAFLAGEIPRTKLRLIIDVATPDTEAGWLALARRRSTRAIAEAVRAFRASLTSAPPSDLDPTATPEHERVTLRLHPEQLGAWHWGRAAGRVILGDDPPDWKILEAMAAEAITTHGIHSVSEIAAETTGQQVRGSRSTRRPPTAADLAFLSRDSRDSHAAFAESSPSVLPEDLDLDAMSVLALYRLILGIIAERRGLDFERSRLLAWMNGRSLHRELGALTLMDYATRRLGMSPRDVRESLALQMDLAMLPQLSGAWRAGSVSSDVAAMLARVVTAQTEGAWLTHAERAPLKRLEVEVDYHLALQSVMSWQAYLDVTQGLPQPEMPTEQLLLDWQAFFGLRGMGDHGSDASSDPEDAHPTELGAAELADPPRLLAELRDREQRGSLLTFSMPREAAGVVRSALRGVMDALGLPDEGSAFHRMLIEFVHEHAQLEELPVVRRRHRVFSRDGWTCRMPHCRARGPLKAHHVEYRSQGGSDDEWNLITACVGDHRLTHLGKQQVSGTSEALVVHLRATGETYRNGLLDRVPGTLPLNQALTRSGRSGSAEDASRW